MENFLTCTGMVIIGQLASVKRYAGGEITTEGLRLYLVIMFGTLWKR